MKSKDYDSVAVARRIRAAGRPIYIAEDDGAAPVIPCDGLRVRQWGSVVESRAIDCTNCSAFIINLVVTANQPKFAISAFSLEVPWKNDHFHWLEDPLQLDGPSRNYRFHLRDVPEFEREHVLNHYADVARVLPCGHSVKGFLLAVGSDPIPERFGHGTMIPAFVIIYDQFGRDHRSPVELQVVRSRTQSRVLRKRNLLDHPDPIAERKPWRISRPGNRRLK
jgi:hypothetical protein